jgi:copper(I)-binding protein
VTDTAGAVYFTVVNPGSRSDRLVRVETAAAGAAETHESVEENGLVRMVARPEGFTIPAGGTLELKPGGKHVMLMGLRAPGSLGDALSVTLRFARAGAITTRAKIVRPGEAMAGGEAH